MRAVSITSVSSSQRPIEYPSRLAGASAGISAAAMSMLRVASHSSMFNRMRVPSSTNSMGYGFRFAFGMPGGMHLSASMSVSGSHPARAASAWVV